MMLCFTSSAMSRARCSMAFTSLLIPPLTFVLILMLTGQGILLTAALLLVFLSFWATLLFPSAVTNKILCLAPASRQNTVLLLILSLNFSLFASSWKIWVLHILHWLSFIETIAMLFRLHIMMFSMNAQNILRLIVVLCIIICLLAPCASSSLAPLIRPLTSLRKLFYLIISVILFPNSRWLISNHLEFEGV